MWNEKVAQQTANKTENDKNGVFSKKLKKNVEIEVCKKPKIGYRECWKPL